MKFREEKDEPCQLQMGPMMDCTFLLLLYFIASSQIKIEEKYLGLLVPGNAPTTPQPLMPELTVAIKENGQVFCNELPMGASDDRLLPLLQGKLKQCIDLFGEKQPVVIHPQPKVRQQRIIDVLAACAAAGVKNLSFFANQ
ncbi:MAG: biopolymer transporter ExbD [Lentisphaerae bacterium]|nr:biopolymer transporter ExbD [Lentisphaerota bacterium]